MGRISTAPARLGGARASAAAPLRRGSAQQRGYDARWAKASRAFLAAHPLCRGCAALGRIEPATLTDHVIPHRGNTVRFWDEVGWQPSCAWHHDAIKQRLEAMFAVGQIAADDLWLDSGAAIALSRRIQPGGGGNLHDR